MTYIPSSTARREGRGTGEERPELAGETDRRPLKGSRLILARLSQEDHEGDMG